MVGRSIRESAVAPRPIPKRSRAWIGFRFVHVISLYPQGQDLADHDQMVALDVLVDSPQLHAGKRRVEQDRTCRGTAMNANPIELALKWPTFRREPTCHWLTGRGLELAAVIPGFSDPTTGRMLQFDGIFSRVD